MSSIIMYGNEYDGQLANGLAPQQFKYRFLVEGDSWMDRSSMFHTSLLQCLAPEFDRVHEDVMFINISMFGDTMRRIGTQARRDFASWLNTDFPWRFDAILLSAGGNDFIDAARDPNPGKGILKNLAGQTAPNTGHECVNPDAVGELVTQWLDPNFQRIYEVVQRSRFYTDIPIFINNYDTPVARNAPAFVNGRAWLYDAYRKNSIPVGLWPEITDSIFSSLQTTIAGWTVGRPNVFSVPTDGILSAAAADSKGDDGDWLNEIHPNASGWRKLSKVWHSKIKEVLI
ncbi:hypothetical protein [Hydrogenophaga sp.]|uniref:hypothetical protein n=1 Tax=Hydrogenophaga sp. TaxID=1904254 RepID=UPI0025C58E92|nr:hypothetical protein [Hydrogenophaga sp.]MBT9465522.1 hypothetical protein [Hydrogenophaga sp.]